MCGEWSGVTDPLRAQRKNQIVPNPPVPHTALSSWSLVGMNDFEREGN